MIQDNLVQEAKIICPSCDNELPRKLLHNPKNKYPIITETLSDYADLHAYRSYKLDGGYMVCPECEADLNVTAIVKQIAEFDYFIKSCHIREYENLKKGIFKDECYE